MAVIVCWTLEGSGYMVPSDDPPTTDPITIEGIRIERNGDDTDVIITYKEARCQSMS
jgi:hypothetical protein